MGLIINEYDTYCKSGGIAGDVSSIVNITNCYNSGEIQNKTGKNNQQHVGGIVGGIGGNISNCYNLGNITTTFGGISSDVGGIEGYNSSTSNNNYNLL